MTASAASFEIRPWVEVEPRDEVGAEVDAIFFESAAVQAFASEAERAAFRERWLGRYLAHYPEHAFVALDPGGRVAGYLAGCLEDPARAPLFSDIAYFPAFADLTARYPAHLHVNVAGRWRGQRIGARLLGAFTNHARAAGAPGAHVVTARGMRNVGFYLANGFHAAGSLAADDRELLFLARRLGD